MRRERSRFARDAAAGKRAINAIRKRAQFWRCLNTGPCYGRPSFIGKESEAADFERNWRRGKGRPKSVLDVRELFIRHMTDELQRQMQVRGFNPANLGIGAVQVREELGKFRAHLIR